MASTTSLTVTPVADLMARIRSSGHDCAATRRAPPIGTLNIVFGARNGSVRLLLESAALATDSVEAPARRVRQPLPRR